MSELVLVANAADQSLSTFRLRSETPELLAVTPLGAKCSTFAIDRERALIYAGVAGDEPAIVTLSLDRESGALTERSRVAAPAGATYLALSAAGDRLFAAFYAAGLGTSWSVADGVLTPGPTTIAYPNLHCVQVTRDGRFAYFVSLGADLIAGFAVGEDGALILVEETAAPAGSGPRHLVLNAAETSVYVLTEFSGEVLHYRRTDDGRLTQAGSTGAYHPARGLSHSRFGADPRAEHLIWGADLHLSPAEDFLWCSERTESTLATVPVGADGTLAHATSFVNTEPQPRGFCVTDDGRLVVTGERSTTISLCSVDRQGVPQLVVCAETGNGANWARSAG